MLQADDRQNPNTRGAAVDDRLELPILVIQETDKHANPALLAAACIQLPMRNDPFSHKPRNDALDAAGLVEKIAALKPELSQVELLRMSLLVSQQTDTLSLLENEETLRQLCEHTSLQLGAASDQHEAVAGELDGLASTAPCDFSTDHLWTLVRAIKVQSQVLNLYLGTTERPAHLG